MEYTIAFDMVITREQHFDPYDHARDRAEGGYAASVPHVKELFDAEKTFTADWIAKHH
jgi:hypothetical protein